MRKRHMIVPLEQVPADQKHLVEKCFYCYCPKHPKKQRPAAVAAVKVEGLSLYSGICANHAEVYPFTEEEAEKHPMLCPYCYPRDGLSITV